MTELEVRTAAVEDADELAAVYRSAYWENHELGIPAKAGSATTEIVADWIRDYHVLVAEQDGEIVAGIRLESTGPTHTTVGRFGVREDRKGEGIGSQLLERAESTARDRGDETVRLTTPPEHPFLVEFYRERGYEKTGEHPLDYRDYDEIVMEKSLE